MKKFYFLLILPLIAFADSWTPFLTGLIGGSDENLSLKKIETTNYVAVDYFLYNNIKLKYKNNYLNNNFKNFQIRVWNKFPTKEDKSRIYVDLFLSAPESTTNKNYTAFIGMSYDKLFYYNGYFPFIGLNLSYATMGINTINNQHVNSVSTQSNIGYGFQTGVFYSEYLWDIEAGYKYLKANINNKVNINGNIETVKLESVSGAYIGVSIKW
jgi:hypothetical protein